MTLFQVWIVLGSVFQLELLKITMLSSNPRGYVSFCNSVKKYILFLGPLTLRLYHISICAREEGVLWLNLVLSAHCSVHVIQSIYLKCSGNLLCLVYRSSDSQINYLWHHSLLLSIFWNNLISNFQIWRKVNIVYV